MARTNRKVKRAGDDPATRIAREIDMPASQVERGNLVVCDVINHNDNDQRAMLRNRAGEADRGSNKGRQTVRRTTKIDQFAKRGIIDRREALACEWYHNCHAARYDTTGVTARYGESSGGGCTNHDHLPKTREQRDAFNNFADARASINPAFLPMFERVVLHGRPLGKLAITFRTVARGLLEHIEGKVGL